MKTRAQRIAAKRRCKTPAMASMPRPDGRHEAAGQVTPPTTERPSTAIGALVAAGMLAERHVEAATRFEAHYRRSLVEGVPRVVASYGAAGGGEVDEEAQQAARQYVRAALRIAGPVAPLPPRIFAL